MDILAKVSVCQPKGCVRLLGGAPQQIPSVAPPLHAQLCGWLCSLSLLGLTTATLKKSHPSNLTASKTGTWTLSSQHSIHGDNSQEAFFLRSWETHQRNCVQKVWCVQGPLLITPQVDTLLPDPGAMTLLRKSRNNLWPRAGHLLLHGSGAEVTWQEVAMSLR